MAHSSKNSRRDFTKSGSRCRTTWQSASSAKRKEPRSAVPRFDEMNGWKSNTLYHYHIAYLQRKNASCNIPLALIGAEDCQINPEFHAESQTQPKPGTAKMRSSAVNARIMHKCYQKMPGTECLGFNAQYPLTPLVNIETCRNHRNLRRESG
jgi:hypothetical protein